MDVSPTGRSTGQKILVVDDEMAISDTLAIIFSTHGYAPRVAYSAEMAIELLEEWQPDLAVVDVVLPGMNGIEFAIFLRASYPPADFCCFRVSRARQRFSKRLKKTAHSFEILAKPVHPTFMLDAVSNLLADSGPTAAQSLKPRSAAGGNHLCGMLKTRFSHAGAAQHPRNFMGARALVEQADLCLGAAVGLPLIDEEMLVGKGGNLGQVGYAKHLLAAAEGP